MTDESQTITIEESQATGSSSVRFTVLYQYPFWVGVLEVQADGELGAARHVFGVEPTGAEVAEFVRRGFVQLLAQAAGAPLAGDSDRTDSRRASSSRRAARQAAQATLVTGISAEAQEALHAQMSERSERKQLAREAAARHKRDAEKRKLREKQRGHSPAIRTVRRK